MSNSLKIIQTTECDYYGCKESVESLLGDTGEYPAIVEGWFDLGGKQFCPTHGIIVRDTYFRRRSK